MGCYLQFPLSAKTFFLSVIEKQIIFINSVESTCSQQLRLRLRTTDLMYQQYTSTYKDNYY